MNEYLYSLIQKYKRKGILIDTNIFLLYLIGSIEPELITEYRRTSQFTYDDFDRTSKFVDLFDLKITTPNVLTEVSNLLGNNSTWQAALGKYIREFEELFTASRQVARNKSFADFGLADTAIINHQKDSFLVLTDDKPLYGYLINTQIDAVNLEELRNI